MGRAKFIYQGDGWRKEVECEVRDGKIIVPATTIPSPFVTEQPPCERCEGTGFIEVEVDYFGRKTEWIKCRDCGGSGVKEEEEES